MKDDITNPSRIRSIETCDKNLRPFRVGDVLKVFHFTGSRRKKHFMYKQITRTQWLGGYGNTPKVLYFFVSHLSLKPESVKDDGGYWMGMWVGVQPDYEIVQCPTADHEDRPKVELPEIESANKDHVA